VRGCAARRAPPLHGCAAPPPLFCRHRRRRRGTLTLAVSHHIDATRTFMLRAGTMIVAPCRRRSRRGRGWAAGDPLGRLDSPTVADAARSPGDKLEEPCPLRTRRPPSATSSRCRLAEELHRLPVLAQQPSDAPPLAALHGKELCAGLWSPVHRWEEGAREGAGATRR
jgi:hypothetical protein